MCVCVCARGVLPDLFEALPLTASVRLSQGWASLGILAPLSRSPCLPGLMVGASLAGAQGDGRDDLSRTVGKVQGLGSRLTLTSLSFRLQTMPRDRLGRPGQWSAAGITIPVCRPLFLPGGA